MEHLIPKKGGGGPRLADAEEKDLLYWLDRKTADLPTSRYPDRDAEWIAAATAELRKRGVEPGQSAPSPTNGNGNGPAPQRSQARPQSQQQTGMTRAEQPQQIVVGTFSNAEAASRALIEAGQQYHLVTPATIVGRLPEGCDVVVSLVQVDPYSSEVYAITGDRKNPKPDDTVGLDRVSLAKIAAAAGVTWVSSRRTDDGSHPHYCSWEAIARFPNFDMTSADYPGNVDIDTREDGDIRGPAAQEIRNKQHGKPGNGDSQLLELRKFLVRHCESKAMNKAIGNKGVRRSYKRSELQKPFAVARLIFTGQSDDPEARRDFRQMIGQRFLGASHQLYGAPTHVAPPALQAPQQHYLQAPPTQYVSSPPPIGTRLDQGDPYDDLEQYPDDASLEKPAAPAAAAPAKPASNPGAQPAAEQTGKL